MNKLFRLILLLLVSPSVFAQTGTVEGAVYRDLDGEKEPIALMQITRIFDDGIELAGETDLAGNFRLELPPGENTLIFKNSALQLKTDTVKLTVLANMTQRYNHEMIPDDQLEVIQIIGESIEAGGSEAKVVADIKEDDRVTAQISGKMIAQKGEGDVGGAAKKITGLSTVGTTLYIRGLGDRYNVAYLNGLPIPSPHPDFRVPPLDIFPTDIVRTIEVSKVMSPELYGDFSGGAFNVATRGFYTKPTLKVSVGGGLNTQTTFGDFRNLSRRKIRLPWN